MASYNSYTDEELLSLLRDSDGEAFTELYNRYWERMITLAHYKLRSAEDAKEVVQDVFLDLWNRRSGLFVRHSFHTYISAAVKYKLLTLLAKKSRLQAKQRTLQPKEDDRSTEEWLSYQQLRYELERTVQNLPEKCRLVFKLSRDSGFTEKEIANYLGISTKTVEAHMSKALKALRGFIRVYLHIFF